MREIDQLHAARLSFFLCLLAVAVDAAGAAIAPFPIKWGFYYDFACVALGLAVLGTLFWAVIIRLDGDTAAPAVAISFTCGRLLEACAVTLVTVVFGGAVILMSALAGAAGFPMQDPLFSSLDAALGFRWEPTIAWLNSSPLAVQLLVASYKSVGITIPICLLFFIATGRSRELWRLVALMALGAFFTAAISCFVPAIGGYTYYGPDPKSVSEFLRAWPQAGTYFVAGLLEVHGRQFTTLDLSHVVGIVQFPSFHGIMALILIIVARPYPLLFWPVLVVNVVMLASTVPVGGHHGVDVLGSLAVVAASLAILEAVEGRPSFAARFSSWWRRWQPLPAAAA